TRYEVALWSRLAAAFAVTPMCVLALPFVFGRMRSSGTGAKMIVGIVIGLTYYLGSRALADGGQVYNVDPLIVGWMPTIALSAVTLFAVSRTR
ncbi:MAG: LptF/LptG family permease, partial [Gammaproteobacteria bacterium]|nr:LptF/LptG family permease [Gammaproteobacteria bacterium]